MAYLEIKTPQKLHRLLTNFLPRVASARNHIQRSFLDRILQYALPLLLCHCKNVSQFKNSYLETRTSEWRIPYPSTDLFLWITLFTWKDLVDCQGLKFFPKFHFSLVRCHNTADIFNSAKLNFQTLSIPFPLYLKTSHLFFKAFLCPTQSIKNRTPLESYFSVLHLEFSSNRFSLPSVHRKKFYRMPCHCVTRLPFFQLPISISLLVMKVLHFNI